MLLLRPRKAWLTLAGLTTVGLLAAGCGSSTPTASPFLPIMGLTSPSQEHSGLGSSSGATGGVLFGGTAGLASEEHKLGRKLAFVRTYYRLGDTFPDSRDRQLMAAGTSLLVSLDTRTGQASYADIAAGREDGTIRAFLESVNQSAVRYHLAAIYICFEHEVDAPNTHRGLGTPAQFIQAWDHVHQLAVSAHLNWQQGGRLHWVWILLHEGFAPLNQRPTWARDELSPSSFFPGAKETDAIGVDGYNSVGCGKNRQPTTPAKTFGPAVAFAHSVGGLPVFIAEWGSSPGGNQPLFAQEMQAFVQDNREIAAISYWDSKGASCTYSVNNNPAALSTLATVARSSVFGGRLTS